MSQARFCSVVRVCVIILLLLLDFGGNTILSLLVGLGRFGFRLLIVCCVVCCGVQRAEDAEEHAGPAARPAAARGLDAAQNREGAALFLEHAVFVV